MTAGSPLPADVLGIDATLSDTERDIRAATRQLVDDLVRPHIARWYADGRIPARELAVQFGEAGLLGMHLDRLRVRRRVRGRIRTGLPGVGGG